MRPPSPEDAEEPPAWVFTEQGNQLANASAARPLRRASAEKALAGFLDRVDEVETDPLCLHVVTEPAFPTRVAAPADRSPPPSAI